VGLITIISNFIIFAKIKLKILLLLLFILLFNYIFLVKNINYIYASYFISYLNY